MGVPAHDQRDFEFAKKNNIDIKQVIVKDKNEQTNELDQAYTENGYLINSNQYNVSARPLLSSNQKSRSHGQQIWDDSWISPTDMCCWDLLTNSSFAILINGYI